MIHYQHPSTIIALFLKHSFEETEFLLVSIALSKVEK